MLCVSPKYRRHFVRPAKHGLLMDSSINHVGDDTTLTKAIITRWHIIHPKSINLNDLSSALYHCTNNVDEDAPRVPHAPADLRPKRRPRTPTIWRAWRTHTATTRRCLRKLVWSDEADRSLYGRTGLLMRGAPKMLRKAWTAQLQMRSWYHQSSRPIGHGHGALLEALLRERILLSRWAYFRTLHLLL